MVKKLIHAACGILLLASTVQSGWAVNLPGWVGSTAQHNWKPRLGGVYWLAIRALVKPAAPPLTQSAPDLPTTMDFFSTSASFNWADLRARRGHVNPYPVVALIIGEEPYNIEGEPSGALYGPQAEKFRVAIRARGFTGPLGLHVHDGGY